MDRSTRRVYGRRHLPCNASGRGEARLPRPTRPAGEPGDGPCDPEGAAHAGRTGYLDGTGCVARSNPKPGRIGRDAGRTGRRPGGRPGPPADAPCTATPRSATDVNASILNVHSIQQNDRICSNESILPRKHTISPDRIAVVFIKPLAPAAFRLSKRGRPPPRTRRDWCGSGGRGGLDAAKKAGGDGLTTGGRSRILGLAGREPLPDAEAAVRPRVGSSRDRHPPSAAMTRTPPATRQASRIRIA